MESSELHRKWTEKYSRFSKIYIPLFVVTTYALPIFLSKDILGKFSSSVVSSFPLALQRYQSLLEMGGLVSFWYILSLVMLLPSVVIISCIYAKTYYSFWRESKIVGKIELKQVFGSSLYVTILCGAFYFLLFVPLPLGEKASLPFLQILFGPAFPVLASGISVMLPMAAVPFLATLIRFFVRQNGGH
ncbi:hypothetical protein [Labrenzia sp. OB1]|uniref:hypothetical protein n=1 Tax=Labrenzia sp. OB1 TaxID=1561204 RepID=UPI0012E8CADE|nr:hypothetical protein [Labrenzia sp. OB1]